MIAEIAKTFLDALKLAPRYLISLGVATAFLLFAGDASLKRLGVYDFAQNNRSWIGLLFIVSFSLFGVDRCIAVFKWARHRKAVVSAHQRRLELFHSLTEGEKQILRFYLAKKTKTNVLRVQDGVVQGLVEGGIIYQSASIGNLREGFAYNISDFAWRYLHENPRLLVGTTNTYRTDKRESSY